MAERKRKPRKSPRRCAPMEDGPEEPYQPRLPVVIRADLRELAELYLQGDLEWFKAFRPEVWT